MSQPANTCQEKTYQQLFRQHALHLRNFLRYKGAAEEQAKDFMQEAFLRLWKACQNVSPAKAKSFLFTVANNLFLDEIRHQKHVKDYETLPHLGSHSETPERLAEIEEFKQKIQQTIEDLPEKQRVVFLMNRVDELTYKEIAERLDISVKAVEKRMHKALLELKKLNDLL